LGQFASTLKSHLGNIGNLIEKIVTPGERFDSQTDEVRRGFRYERSVTPSMAVEDMQLERNRLTRSMTSGRSLQDSYRGMVASEDNLEESRRPWREKVGRLTNNVQSFSNKIDTFGNDFWNSLSSGAISTSWKDYEIKARPGQHPDNDPTRDFLLKEFNQTLYKPHAGRTPIPPIPIPKQP
jgi:hypothetical protein